MPLYYDEFTDLLLDWPMILVGWRGFAGHKLSAEQVVSHAADLIGHGTPEQDEVTALLANTDSSEWQTIDRYLEQICEGPFDWTVALREWRLSALRQLLRTLPQQEQVEACPEEEKFDVVEEIHDFWYDYRDQLPEDKEVLPNYGDTTAQMLAEQQAWAEREEAALRGGTGAAT